MAKCSFLLVLTLSAKVFNIWVHCYLKKLMVANLCQEINGYVAPLSCCSYFKTNNKTFAIFTVTRQQAIQLWNVDSTSSKTL